MVKIYVLLSFLCNRFLSRSDSVTVSVWNQRKVLRQNGKEGAGFLGCVKLTPSLITKVKDRGCKLIKSSLSIQSEYDLILSFSVQTLNLVRKSHEEEETIKGEIFCKFFSPFFCIVFSECVCVLM